MNKISIIIPVFNVENYLSQCLNSVVNQTYKNLEIIIINDGSTDSSQQLIEDYKKKDSRIKLLNQKNQGVSAARNAGIAIAKGTFIGFVDGDDFVEEDYIEELFNLINKPNGEMALCGFNGSSKRYLNDGVIDLNKTHEDKIIKLFKSYLIFGPFNKLFRAEIIKNNNILFNRSFEFGEDLLFNLEYIKFINRIEITSKVLYNYNIDVPNSLAKQYKLKRFIDTDYQINSIEKYFSAIGLISNEARLYLIESYYWNTYNCIYELYKNIGLISKKEAINWIQEIFNFYYLNSKNQYSYKTKLTILIKVFKIKNKWLAYYYMFLKRKFKV